MVRPARHDDHLAIDPQPAGGDERQAMHTPDSSWQDAATGASNGMQRLPSPGWQQALSLLRSPVFTAILGAVMVLGLLLAFENVVAQAVAHAEQQRSARDAHDAAVWRCKQLRGGGDRGTCLIQVSQARDLATQAR
jgi:hypothetical protein